MRLIGLHGRLRSGKDTAYEEIERIAKSLDKKACRRAFGDNLKLSGMAALGLQGLDLANKIKEQGEIVVRIDGEDIHSISGREFWQYYGTEAHRNPSLGSSFSEDFWLDNLLPHCKWTYNFAPLTDYAVVTDVRFPNEAQRIKDLGGEIWWINADERLGPPNTDHPSEKRLPIGLLDYELTNNGPKEEFRAQVRDLLAAGKFDA